MQPSATPLQDFKIANWSSVPIQHYHLPFILLPICINWPVLGTLYKWNHMDFMLCLDYFTKHDEESVLMQRSTCHRIKHTGTAFQSLKLCVCFITFMPHHARHYLHPITGGERDERSWVILSQPSRWWQSKNCYPQISWLRFKSLWSLLLDLGMLKNTADHPGLWRKSEIRQSDRNHHHPYQHWAWTRYFSSINGCWQAKK